MAGQGAKFLIGPQVSIWEGTPELPLSFGDPLNIGENGELTLEPEEPEISLRKSNAPDGTDGQVLNQDLTPGALTLTLSVDDIESSNGSLEMFASALSGVERDMAQAATAASPVYFVVNKLDRNFHPGLRDLVAGSAVLHKVSSPATGAARGTATGGTTTTLVDSGQAWTADDLIGKKVVILTGTGAGQILAITDNDATSITFALATAPAAGSTYAIVESAALVDGTDYVLLLDRSDIKILSGGALAAGDAFAGTIGVGAKQGKAILGGTKQHVTYSMKGLVKNKLTGIYGYLYIPKVVSYASENVELAGNDFIQAVLKGKPEKPTRALLQHLGWDKLVDSDGNNLWGPDPTNPTTLYLFIPSETSA